MIKLPKYWDGIISQHLNRKFSRPIARFLAKNTNFTPNQISFLSFLVAVFSGAAFFLKQNILGGVLAQTASILDGVDGDLAVLTGKTTVFGGFFDSVLDRYADAVIILGLAYNTLTSNNNIWNIVTSIAALFGSLMISYSRAKAESLKIYFRTGVSGYAANRDVRLFIIMIGGILGQILITLVILAVLTNFVALKRLVDARKILSSKG